MYHLGFVIEIIGFTMEWNYDMEIAMENYCFFFIIVIFFLYDNSARLMDKREPWLNANEWKDMVYTTIQPLSNHEN